MRYNTAAVRYNKAAVRYNTAAVRYNTAAVRYNTAAVRYDTAAVRYVYNTMSMQLSKLSQNQQMSDYPCKICQIIHVKSVGLSM